MLTAVPLRDASGRGPDDLLLVVGIQHYADEELPELPHVIEEVHLVTAAFAKAGFAIADQLTDSCTLPDVERYLLQGERATRRLVVYWTGHGVAAGKDCWLLTTDSRKEHPTRATSASPAWLADLLTGLDGPTQVLVILDCCGAGSTARAIAEAISTSPRRLPTEGRAATGIALISSTYGDSPARPLLFAHALAESLKSGPPTTPWPAQQALVTAQELADASDRWLRHLAAPDHHRVMSTGDTGIGFARNPMYHPTARDSVIDGWTLVRRSSVLDVLYGWISGADSGLFLLSGSLGTGKSYVLRQLVEEMPTNPALTTAFADAAVARTVGLLVSALAPRLGLILSPADCESPEQLLERSQAVRRPVVVIVDSLDETQAEDRRAIVQRLLVPLSASAGVRVVVAIRGGRTAGAEGDDVALLQATAAARLDLDNDPDATADIQRAVGRILRSTPASPYRERPDVASGVAAEIARGCDRIFLLARTIATRLAHEIDVVSPGADILSAMMSRGLGAAISGDLNRFGVDGAQLIRKVLAPLAWVEGLGIPRKDVWPRMSAALASDRAAVPITDQDIEWVLASVGYFVIASVLDNRVTYRLQHRGFVDFFGMQPGAEVEVHRRICDALRPTLTGWRRADLYVREHLSEHAEKAGVVVNLFEDDPDFLLYADPRTAVPVAVRATANSYNIELYLRAGPLLTNSSPEVRAFVLQSLASDPHPYRSKLSFSMTPPCRLVWKTGPPSSPHQLVRTGSEELSALAVVRGNGRWLLATASRPTIALRRVTTQDGQMQVFVSSADSLAESRLASEGVEIIDPNVLAPSEFLRSRRGKGVEALVVAPVLGREPVLVVAYQNGVLEGWDVDRRQTLWTTDSGGPVLRLCLLRAHGEFMVAATNSTGPVRLFRPSNGDFIGWIGTGGGALFAIGFHAGGQDVVCVGFDTGWLEFWDADRPILLHCVRPDVVWTPAAIYAGVNGRGMLIGARADGRLEMREAATGRLMSLSRDVIEETVEELRVLGHTNAPQLVSAAGHSVTGWATVPLARGTSSTGHTDTVRALIVLPGNGTSHSQLASAGADGSIRIWRSAASYGNYDNAPDNTAYLAAFSAVINGRPVVIGERDDCYVVFDAREGSEVRSFPRQTVIVSYLDDPEPPIRAVATVGAHVLALTGHNGSAQQMWSLLDGTRYALPTPQVSQREAEAVVVGPDTNPLLVLGDGRGAVHVLDFTGRMVSRLEDSTGGIPRTAFVGERHHLVVVQVGTRLDLADAMHGTRLHSHQAMIDVPGAIVRPLAAATEDGLTAVAYGVGAGIWLWRPTLNLVELVANGDGRCGTVVEVAGRPLIAIGAGDRVLVIRPSDGTMVLDIPFVGRVWSLCSPGPTLLGVVAARTLYVVELR